MLRLRTGLQNRSDVDSYLGSMANACYLTKFSVLESTELRDMAAERVLSGIVDSLCLTLACNVECSKSQ